MAWVLSVLSLGACSGDGPPPPPRYDAGQLDRGQVVETDAGPVDAGAPVDAGFDAGSSDAGPSDAGPADTGPPPVMGFRNVAPSSGVSVRSRRPTFVWTAAAGAASYRVEVATSRAFASVESTFTATGATSILANADVAQGRRWWRVVALDGGNRELGVTSVWPLNVGRAMSDLNGDGLSDIVIGAKGYDTQGMNNRGRVAVYFGAAMPATTPGWSVEGAAENDSFGTSVSSRGDLNGDGVADLVVGAPFAMGGNGQATVYLGGSSPSNRPTLTLNPPMQGSDFGRSVAILGDINGDGFDDFAVGASTANNSSMGGQVFVYFGGATLDATPDLTLGGSAPQIQFGRAVAGAGDVNGDGFADFLVGAPRAPNNNVVDVGAAYLYLGGERPDTTADGTYRGTMMSDFFGATLTSAYDIDRDGFADFAVGAPRTSGGESPVFIFGGGTAVPTMARTSIAPPSGARGFGRGLGSAGDVNGDGHYDLIVGAPVTSGAENETGRAFLYVGAANGIVTTPAATYDGAVGGDSLGSACNGAGDVNGDDLGDVLVGAERAPFAGRDGPGSAYLYRGNLGPVTTRLWTITGSTMLDVNGEEVGSAFGGL